jgi:CheY-like chemotaxis protein
VAKPLILVVDDAPQLGAIVGALGRRAGWESAHRADVAGGWDYLQTRLPDLLLLDMNLPGPRGSELARRVRAAAAPLADLPVALFGHPDLTSDVAEGLEAGADFFVSKELVCRPEEWQRRVSEILTRPHGRRRAPVIRWGLSGPPPHPPAGWADAVNGALGLAPVRGLGPEVLRAVLRRALAHALPELPDVRRDAWLRHGGGALDATRDPPAATHEAVAVLAASLAEQAWCLLGGGPAAAFRAALAAALPGLAETPAPQ